MDKPIFPEQPLENPANSALTFQDIKGNSHKFEQWEMAKNYSIVLAQGQCSLGCLWR